VLFGVALAAVGELLVQRSGPVMYGRRGLQRGGGKFRRHDGCSPRAINVLARDLQLFDA